MGTVLYHCHHGLPIPVPMLPVTVLLRVPIPPSTMFSVAIISPFITMHAVLVPGPSFAIVAVSSFQKKRSEQSTVLLMGDGIQQMQWGAARETRPDHGPSMSELASCMK